VTDLNQNETRGIQGTVSNTLALVSGAMKSSSSPKEEPERLVERAQNGDREAFEQIYRQQVGRIHALCWRLTGDADLAEELTQEAFVRAWRKLHLFSGRSALSTWLHRLTVNVVMADHRVHGTRRRRQLPLSSWRTTVCTRFDASASFHSTMFIQNATRRQAGDHRNWDRSRASDCDAAPASSLGLRSARCRRIRAR